MPYDEGLAERLRDLLGDRPGLVEKKMFGGLSFLLHGNMCCGVSGDDLMLRVGAAGSGEALSQPHARPMDFTGRPLQGFVFVAPEGFESDEALAAWIARATAFVGSLPSK